MTQEVQISESKALAIATRDGILVPRVIAAGGDKAARRFLGYFAATIRNKNTRMAYHHACLRFFAWCDHHKIGEIADVEPLHVAAYVEALGKDFEKPTVKQHLAAIRMLFYWLVTGQIVATNPTHSVRGPKHVVKTGKTTVLTGEQARELLDSIDTSTLAEHALMRSSPLEPQQRSGRSRPGPARRAASRNASHTRASGRDEYRGRGRARR